MLVLTRKLQEQIHIGDNITVTILKVKGNTVRVGIDAPRDIRVMRAELPMQEEAAKDADERPGSAAAGRNVSPLASRLANIGSAV